MKDRDFLTFIHARLTNVHGENESYDYMFKLRAIIAATPENRDTHVDEKAQLNLAELIKALKKKDEEQREADRLPTDEELREAGFSRCEQCDEIAWDGRICQSCGAKKI